MKKDAIDKSSSSKVERRTLEYPWYDWDRKKGGGELASMGTRLWTLEVTKRRGLDWKQEAS